MILNRTPNHFHPTLIKRLPTAPTLMLFVRRRTDPKPYKNNWLIVYSIEESGCCLYLIKEYEARTPLTRIPLSDFYEKSEPATEIKPEVEKKMKPFAKLWGTTVEELIDRIYENLPKSW